MDTPELNFYSLGFGKIDLPSGGSKKAQFKLMKKKDTFSCHINQLIVLLTYHNSHMLKTNNKEEEQKVLDQISQTIKSYSAKMTKSQLK